MERLNRYVVEHPWLFIGINVVITLIFAGFASGLIIDDDMMNYLPENDPVVETFQEVGDLFQGNAVGVVMVETDNVFTNEALQHIGSLTDLCTRVEGVSSVVSLTNVMDMRPDGDMLQVESLVEENRTYSDGELADLREYVMGKEMYAGNLVSEDGRFSLIMVKLASDADNKTVIAELEEIIDKTDGGQFRHYRTGTPFVAVDGDRSAKNDLRNLLPTVIFLVVAVLFLTFRTVRGTVIPAVAVVVSVVWAMGLLALTGQDLTTVGIAIPVLLIAVGSAYGIHVMSEYYATVRSEETKKEDLTQAMNQVGMPIFLSCLTTIAGFASLVTADLSPIKQFGLYTAFGVLAAFITAFTLIPALLAVLRYRPGVLREKSTSARFANMASGIFRNRAAVITVVAIIVIAAISQFPRLTFDTDLAGFFRPKSPTRIAIDLVNDNFGGANPLHVHIQGDMKSPFVLRQMQAVGDFLESVEAVHPISYATLIEEANHTINGPARIPATRNQVASLGLFLEGQEQVRDYLTPDYSQGLIVARVAETKSTKMAGINEQIRTFLDNLPTSAYVINQEIASGDLAELAEASLIESLTDEIAQQLWENPDSAHKQQVRIELVKLLDYSQPVFAQEYKLDIADTIEDNLSGENLWFELDNMSESQELAWEMFLQGATAEELAIGWEEVNPTCDPFDLEDAAYFLWDDLDWMYQTARQALLHTAASHLLAMGNKELSYDALAGTLRDIWVDEVYVTDLPASLAKDPAVRRDEFEVQLTGPPVVYEVTTARLQTSQWRSLSISLVLVALLLILQLRSLPMGLIACTPIVLTVLINFGTMAVTGIPLDVATTMIASVAIGTGVDYSIHFANRLRRALGQSGSLEASLQLTLGQVGRAITANALSVALGFLVLTLSSTVTIAQFGGLTALTMVVSAVLALVFLPALYAVTGSADFIAQSRKKEGVVR
ncbi:MAG: MMPL family transporter [Firmicutes bacterium]|nr:MMPL family transporter [Bacillota bacterium]